MRSYEVEHVLQLLHLDFHHGSRKVLTQRGTYVKPLLVGFIDDRSRFLCHAQWYTNEGSRELVHGLSQALQKVGLPRTSKAFDVRGNQKESVMRRIAEIQPKQASLRETASHYFGHAF